MALFSFCGAGEGAADFADSGLAALDLTAGIFAEGEAETGFFALDGL